MAQEIEAEVVGLEWNYHGLVLLPNKKKGIKYDVQGTTYVVGQNPASKLVRSMDTLDASLSKLLTKGAKALMELNNLVRNGDLVILEKIKGQSSAKKSETTKLDGKFSVNTSENEYSIVAEYVGGKKVSVDSFVKAARIATKVSNIVKDTKINVLFEDKKTQATFNDKIAKFVEKNKLNAKLIQSKHRNSNKEYLYQIDLTPATKKAPAKQAVKKSDMNYGSAAGVITKLLPPSYKKVKSPSDEPKENFNHRTRQMANFLKEGTLAELKNLFANLRNQLSPENEEKLDKFYRKQKEENGAVKATAITALRRGIAMLTKQFSE